MLELSVILFAIDFVLNEIDLQKAVTVGEEGKINICVCYFTRLYLLQFYGNFFLLFFERGKGGE